MAHTASSFLDNTRTPRAQARHVLLVTAQAWHLAPRSAQALARRADRGYVPRRARVRAAAAAAAAQQPVTGDLRLAW